MRKRKSLLHAIYFILPAVILFLTFVYYPFISSLYYSFTLWDGVSKPVYIGLENYKNLFDDKLVMHAALNTFYIVLFGVIINNPLSLFMALLLHKPLKTRSLLRTVFYIPVVISMVVISVVWGNLLQYEGVVNEVLLRLGLADYIKDWLGNTGTSLIAVIMINVWYATGYGAVIYLAGLESVPSEIFEAAQIDGAKGWKKFIYVTLPLVMPSVTICTFLGMVGSLKFFDLPYVLTNGGPGDSTSTLALVIYKFAFKNSNFGYATAAGILFMILILIITMLQLSFTRKREVEY
ncbi:sugar ABC transporter permease [Paenibacillus psychroresistens]|uniref:Sugar ABC transporter permease n=1 Tax=Paenibacillus psychroresistens TaxID=1778678 RepID=A0A6B8RU86_9BACL|nr:sugar ABC transporter permease [Paenibacillus psychroresistens]QGQ99165.1 sugar ABC transporter permease [Paenibacillus psychroresistens]